MNFSLHERIFEVAPTVYTPGPYTVTPLTAPVNKETCFRVRIAPGYRPISCWGITELRMISHDGVMADGAPALWNKFISLNFSFEDETLCFPAFLHQEGKYTLQLMCGERLVLEFFVYALENDLYNCIPLKGDFHSHSSVSDGRQNPELAAIRGRKRGLDFLAVTDHGLYEGSTEAINAMKDKGSSLLLCPGEEMHLPLRPDLIKPFHDRWLEMPWVEGCLAAHLVNFGGSFSINQYARENKARYLEEVAAREAELPDELSPFDRFTAAAAEWAFDKVREGGGLAVYPHPYWPLYGRNAVSDAFNKTMFERGKFDAFEAANNKSHEYNYLAQSEYARQRGNGRMPSVVGCSDVHDTDSSDKWAYTIVLAKDFSLQGICEAVRAGFCCAVMPAGEGALPVVTGDFRIVRYVYFLLGQYFPEHDQWCSLEAELLERSMAMKGFPFASAVKETTSAIAEFCQRSFPGTLKETEAQ